MDPTTDPKIDPELLAPADTNTPLPRGFARGQESLRRALGGNPTETMTGPLGPTGHLPRIGDHFLGFNIVGKLGEGGFGVVYLAEEVRLACRKVALKFTNRPNREPERLAEMQHTNIVPVYSVHTLTEPSVQVLCMPYLGKQTLQTVVDAVTKVRGNTRTLPRTGAALLSEGRSAGAGAKTDKSKAKARLRAKMKSRMPAAVPAPDATATIGTPQPVRERLEALSFKESVVWLFTRLADALAHAHDRGILHLDLKPSNILMTDAGVPMVLDFGLAYDTRTGQYDQAGGTPRYMAPEQLIGYAHPGHVPPDPRMDLYALGLMFHELLTGAHPFEATSKPGNSIHRMLDARRAQPPRVRAANPDVDPAVDAIVAKLLQPDPARRYASAADLLADLTLHQENRPLKFAGNPSVWERVRKARRRHPLLAACMVAGLLGMSTVGGVATAAHQARQRSEAEAAIQAAQFHTDVVNLRSNLTTMDRSEDRKRAVERGVEMLAGYDVKTPHWQAQPAVARLKPEDRDTLERDVTELAALLAHACRLNALNDREPGDGYARALEFNALATKLRVGPPLAGLAAQRADLLRLAKLPAEPAEPAVAAEPSDPLDYYLVGLANMAVGDYPKAVAALGVLAEKHPAHAAGQLSLGWVQYYQGNFAEAAERFQVAKALAPHDPRAPFNRGLLLRIGKKFDDALAEFNIALDRDPDFGTAYYYRAETLRYLDQVDRRRTPERRAVAVADCTRAIELGEMEYAAHVLRAELHEADGRIAEADADRAWLRNREPKSESEFHARGKSKLAKDPHGALHDFNSAIALNRRYLSAWQAKAAVLNDDRLNPAEPSQALAAYDKVLELVPRSAPALAQQAVILARMKLADRAREAVERLTPWNRDDGRTWFDCARALAAIGEADTALEYLKRAFRDKFADFKAVAAAEKNDFATLKDHPEFTKVVAAAKSLQARR